MSLPAICAVATVNPGGVDVMTSEVNMPLLKGVRGLRRVLSYEKFFKHKGIESKWASFKELRGLGFKHVIDFRQTALPLLFGSHLIAHLLFFLDTKFLGDACLRLVSRCGVPACDHGEYYKIDAVSLNKIKDMFEKGFFNKGKIVVIATDARSRVKSWPLNRFISLADSLINKFDVNVVFVAENKSQISVDLPSGKFLDLRGKTSVLDLLSIISLGDAVVTTDSAPMHAAWFLSRPSICMFGPTDDKRYFSRKNGMLLTMGQRKCRPCKRPECKFNMFQQGVCMLDLKPAHVLEKIGDIL